MKIAVLGAGMVGRTIALDLAKDHEVTSFDLSAGNLRAVQERNAGIATREVNLTGYDQYPVWLAPFDTVVCAVPGFMGYRTLEAVIRAGKDAVDISFFPENSLQLDSLARSENVTVITDCGVAPGMSNFILGRYNEELKADTFECYVGGLPLHPKPPYFYKAPFSPIDVIEEYTRPARYKEHGKIITKPALTDREIMDFGNAGRLESFNTDGLRSLLFTMPHVDNMKEKTLRYPGHIDLIITLKDLGFFNDTPTSIRGMMVSPLEVTTAMLINEWKLQPDEPEFTVMKVIVKGGGRMVEYNLYDEYDPATRTSSMSRTTGYTCTAAVGLIAGALFTRKGVFPPELVGSDKACFDYVINYLKARNVIWECTIRPV